jgi:hypothetical protein
MTPLLLFWRPFSSKKLKKSKRKNVDLLELHNLILYRQKKEPTIKQILHPDPTDE